MLAHDVGTTSTKRWVNVSCFLGSAGWTLDCAIIAAAVAAAAAAVAAAAVATTDAAAAATAAAVISNHGPTFSAILFW